MPLITERLCRLSTDWVFVLFYHHLTSTTSGHGLVASLNIFEFTQDPFLDLCFFYLQSAVCSLFRCREGHRDEFMNWAVQSQFIQVSFGHCFAQLLHQLTGSFLRPAMSGPGDGSNIMAFVMDVVHLHTSFLLAFWWCQSHLCPHPISVRGDQQLNTEFLFKNTTLL